MKRTISLVLIAAMLLSCFCLPGFAAIEDNDIVFEERFDKASENVVINNDTFSYVERPENGQDVNTNEAYGALVNDHTKASKVKVNFNNLYTGEFVYEMDFRLEGKLSSAPNEIKLVRFLKDTTAKTLITLWAADENGYKIRVCAKDENGNPKYIVDGMSGSLLQYKKWYKLRVKINTVNNTYDVYINDALVCLNQLPYNNSFESGVNNAEIYTDAAKDYPILIDNIVVRRELSVQSNAYFISDDVIMGATENVSVAEFLSNINLPLYSNAVLYSDYAAKTLNTGNVNDGDILEIKSTLDETKIKLYTVKNLTYATTYYVSPTGRNTNDGLTPDTAFASLAHAKNVVQFAKQNMDAAYTVKILAGNYVINNVIEFTEKDGGSAAYPIVYEAYGNGPVNFKGSVTLTADKATAVKDSDILDALISADAKDNLLQIDLKAEGITIPAMSNAFGYGRSGFKPLRVYINGQALTEARFPNAGDGHIPLSKINNADTYAADGGYDIQYADADAPLSRTSLWDTENRDIYIAGTIAHEYAANHFRVKTFDPKNKNIVTEGTGSYGTYVGKSYFYFANVLEEIDVPGESYLDEEKGILYFYPYGDMTNATIEVGVYNDNMIKMTDADYITFKNLNFGYSRNKIFETVNTDYLTIDGCEFAHTGATAMTVNGTNIKIQNNHIYDLAGATGIGGIHMTGNGSRKDLISDNNKIINNKIHDTDVIYNVSQSPAIYLLDSVGTEISNNEIYNGTAYVIRITDANDILMKRNIIHDAVTMSSDAGAITWGRDVTLLGFQVIENYFYNIGNDIGIREQESTGITCKRIGQQALFHDDGSSGPYAYGNIFYQSKPNGTRNTYTSIKANGGQYGIWENNIFIGGEGAAYFGSWHTGTNGKTTQDTWWLRNYNVYEIPREADGSKSGSAIYWDRINNGELNFFENDVWKGKYGGQFGAYWTLFTPEQKTALEAAYDPAVTIKKNQALLNAVQVHENLLTDTNIIKNNILIDTLTPIEYKDTANYHEAEGSVTGIYTTEQAEGFFKDYGTDFTLTDAGLASIQKTVPAFKAIDFDAIGLQSDVGAAASGFKIQNTGKTADSISINIINEETAPKSGILVVTTYNGDKIADIKLESVVLSGKTLLEKTIEITKAYDSVKVYVLQDFFTMRILSNVFTL